MTDDHALTYKSFQMYQTHAETWTSRRLLEDTWCIKTCSKFGSKYQTCLIFSNWTDSYSEVKNQSLCPSCTTLFSVNFFSLTCQNLETDSDFQELVLTPRPQIRVTKVV